MFRAIQPEPARRLRELPRFFAGTSRVGLRYGELHVLPDDAAVAIWLPPGVDLTPPAILRSGLAPAVLRFGPAAMRRFLRIVSNFDRAERELMPEPRWHLLNLGVEPSQQGRGRGGEVIAPVLARADQAGQPCYLETSEERNVPFYERHGFICPGRRDPDGLPPFWPMVRRPRPVSGSGP